MYGLLRFPPDAHTFFTLGSDVDVRHDVFMRQMETHAKGAATYVPGKNLRLSAPKRRDTMNLYRGGITASLCERPRVLSPREQFTKKAAPRGHNHTVLSLVKPLSLDDYFGIPRLTDHKSNFAAPGWRLVNSTSRTRGGICTVARKKE